MAYNDYPPAVAQQCAPERNNYIRASATASEGCDAKERDTVGRRLAVCFEELNLAFAALDELENSLRCVAEPRPSEPKPESSNPMPEALLAQSANLGRRICELGQRINSLRCRLEV
jgi:hypothetical protein